MSIGKKLGVILAAGGIVIRRSAEGVQVLVVHRPRYDDWSFPKGKHDNGERLQETAIREVLEETGYKIKLLSYLGAFGYSVDGGPKVILYWLMEAVDRVPKRDEEEVDEVAWLAPEAAFERLRYDSERDLLRKALARL